VTSSAWFISTLFRSCAIFCIVFVPNHSHFGAGIEPIPLLILMLWLMLLLFFLLLLLVGTTYSKSLRLRRFKSDRDDILQNFSSSKHHRLTESDFWYGVTFSFSRWRPPLADAAYAAASSGCPLALRARMISLACCMRYSFWCIVRLCLLYHIPI